MKRNEQLTEGQLRRLVLAMFLAGLPMAGFIGYSLIIEPNDQFSQKLGMWGGLVWISWLFRYVYHEMPRFLRLLIWSGSAIWHGFLMPLCLLGMLVWFGWYFMIHCFFMLGLSVKLIFEDRPSRKRGEQDAAPQIRPRWWIGD